MLAAVGPVVSAVVELVAGLVQALAGDTGVALGAAEQVGAGAPAVTGRPPAENPPILSGHMATMSPTDCQGRSPARPATQGRSQRVHFKGRVSGLSGNVNFLVCSMPDRTGSCLSQQCYPSFCQCMHPVLSEPKSTVFLSPAN